MSSLKWWRWRCREENKETRRESFIQVLEREVNTITGLEHNTAVSIEQSQKHTSKD